MRPLLLLVLVAAASCQTDRPLYDQLQRMQSAAQPARVAAERIVCPDKTAICARLLLERGAACLTLTESADPARRAAMRQCALDDFTAARRQLPPDAGADTRSAVMRGLIEALIVQRDNTFDAQVRVDAMAKLDGLASTLHGTAEGAYAAANNALNRVLTEKVPQAQACAMLAQARTMAEAAGASGEMAARIQAVRREIDAAAGVPIRHCAQ